jgi:acyl carrier protein
VLIRHANLPRTTSGKVQRNLCRQQLVASELKVLADWQRQTDQGDSTTATSKSERFKLDDRPMTPDEIDRLGERVESWLLNWLVQRAAIPKTEVHRDKPFAEYGLDSLTAVELSQELEDWLGVEVVPTVAWNYPTPATLSVYLAREASGANAAEAEAAAAEVNVDVEDEFAQLLAEIEGLSDDEAKSMLENE